MLSNEALDQVVGGFSGREIGGVAINVVCRVVFTALGGIGGGLGIGFITIGLASIMIPRR